MTKDSTTTKPKKSWLKLVLFTLLCLIVSSLVIGWMMFGHYIMLFYWNEELNKALIVAKSDSERGRQQVEKVLNDAATFHVAPSILMRMHRVYAMSLYMQDEVALADEQVDKVIKLGESQPPTDTGVADQLTHAWQERATERHHRWLTDKTKPDGAKDQEMSVKVAEAGFGPDHEQTIYKAAGLAKIYADIGKIEDADKVIDRCVKAVETKDSVKQCAWYVYAMLAHTRSVEHRYKEAVAAYLKGREAAVDEEQSNRVWSEYMSGLYLHKTDDNPLLKQTRTLLNKGNYAELDRLGEKFIKEKTVNWDGFGPLDQLIEPLEIGPEITDKRFDQMKLDLEKWISKNPKSVIAPSALANLHIFRAWSVYNDQNSKFDDYMNEAKKVVTAHPGVEDKCPAAYTPLLRLTYVTRDKEELYRINAKAIKQWPNSFSIDKWTTKLLGTRSMGDEGDQEKYITKRASTMGGAEGDKFYARCAWSTYYNGEGNRIDEMDWNRIMRGFKQIFKEYPDEVEARIALLQLAISFGHKDDANNMEW